MSRAVYFIVFILLAAAFSKSYAQSPDSVTRLLENYANKFPQEKLYLHLDRPAYAPGDTIWFKAYLTDAVVHRSDSVSKIIYVDLVKKDNGQLIRHKLLWNEGGFARGEFYLPDSLKDGRYELVGFTNYMKNFSSDFFFRKEILIYRLSDIKQKSLEEEDQFSKVADLQFFPEGGNLIAGLQNRVAFKAVNKFGHGINLEGFIISTKGDTIAGITSQHGGMGSFIFKPEFSQKYIAVIAKSPDPKRFELPEATATGYTLSVDNLSSKDVVKVTARNVDAIKDRPMLIAQQRGVVVFSAQGSADGNSFSWTVPKKNIAATGIVQLTLFNRKGIPQCERLIYHSSEAGLKISVTPDKTEYLPFEKVVLSINAKLGDQPVAGNFSLSATDLGQVFPETDGININNYLLLTSDVQALGRDGVKGVIEAPDYYFNPSNSNALIHLDILLMTQGWRRFLWRDVLAQKSANLQFDIEQGVTVQGKAVLTNGKKPGKPLFVSIFYAQGNEVPKYSYAAVDIEGDFTFYGLEAQNETTLFLQDVRDKTGRNANFSIIKPELPAYEAKPDLTNPLLFGTKLYESLEHARLKLDEMNANIASNKVKLLKEVEITSHRNKIKDPRKVMYEGTAPTTVVVSAQMCASAISILQLIQGHVAGLEVSQDVNGGYYVSVRGPKSLIQRNPEVIGVMLDGVLIDLQILTTIPPCTVESIDVITHPVSSLNFPGLISILTKGGNSTQRDWTQKLNTNEPGTLIAKIQGYDTPREFYSPKYPLPDASQPVEDFRPTLFWNPVIKTDRHGNAKVVFWNSAERTTIRLSIEGMSNDGKPGAATSQYLVK